MSAPSKTAPAEEPASEPNDEHNPLWVVVIGMAWVFGVIVAIMAFTGGN
jgi:hypothetical protein